MPSTSKLALRYPDGNNPANVPLYMQQLAEDVDDKVGGVWTAYTPSWTCEGSAPVVGNGTLLGQYRRLGKTVDLRIWLAFGSATSGGTGIWHFGYPAGVAPDVAKGQYWMPAKVHAASGGGSYAASAFFGGTDVTVYAPFSTSNCSMGPVRNCVNAGTPGTGIPASGGYPFTDGSNVHIAGTFEVA